MIFLDYERIEHHKHMISDKKRTLAFKKAIEKAVKNKIVVDIGAGTGILSFFAAKTAKKVYAIERTDVIEVAKKLAKENNIDNIIFIHADSDEAVLPEKCDVIISECIGYFALQENMLSDLIRFRRKWLKPDGIVIPDKIRLYISLVDSKKHFDDKINIRRNYGLSLKTLEDISLNSNYPCKIKAKEIVSNIALVKEIDLLKDDEINFNEKLILQCQKNSTIYGLCGFFDAHLYNNISLSNKPGIETHWKQQYFPVLPINAKNNEVFELGIKADLQKSLVDFSWNLKGNIYTTKNGIRLKEKLIRDSVVFILIKDSKFLAEKRKSADSLMPNKIVIPGGHIERNESMEDALKREIFEELNVKANDFKFLGRFLFDAGSEIMILNYFLCRQWKGKIKPKEAEELIWIGKNELDKFSYDIDRQALNLIDFTKDS